VAAGCREAGCALIGGETAEMPGMYADGDFDLAGFVVGAAERGTLLPREADMREGDILIGLASSGAHSNGYSLIRRILERAGKSWADPAPFDDTESLGDIFLAPTRIYVKPVLPLIRKGHVKGVAHITGGGLTENTPRMLSKSLKPAIDYGSWPRPALFEWLQEAGGVSEEEMRRTFNLGVGLTLCIAPEDEARVLEALDEAGESAWTIGTLERA